MIFLHASAFGDRGRVAFAENGEIWWIPLNGDPQLLAGTDDLCGIGIFNTGFDDVFRDVCTWHDHAYKKRAFFEERGWTRKDLDDYFLELMLEKANYSPRLVAQAYEYYGLVRTLGWIFYNKHPRYIPNPQVGAQQLAGMQCANLLAEIIASSSKADSIEPCVG